MWTPFERSLLLLCLSPAGPFQRPIVGAAIRPHDGSGTWFWESYEHGSKTTAGGFVSRDDAKEDFERFFEKEMSKGVKTPRPFNI